MTALEELREALASIVRTYEENAQDCGPDWAIPIGNARRALALPLAPLAAQTQSVHLDSAYSEPSDERGQMAAPQWISVEAQLPEGGIDDYVLAASEGRLHVKPVRAIRNAYNAAQLEGDTCFYTHWMPLPEPPK